MAGATIASDCQLGELRFPMHLCNRNYGVAEAMDASDCEPDELRFPTERQKVEL